MLVEEFSKLESGISRSNLDLKITKELDRSLVKNIEELYIQIGHQYVFSEKMETVSGAHIKDEISSTVEVILNQMSQSYILNKEINNT